tara:strand:+ start:46009 stop:46290 length:282 start_codon:yes stop_codon:yes gene_type:complete
MKQIQLIGINPDDYKNDLVKEITESILQNLSDKFSNHKPTADLLSIDEVAEYFNIHKTTVWKWCNEGKLIKYGIGARVYFKRDEVEEALIILN